MNQTKQTIDGLKGGKGYFKGNECEYTGTIELLYGSWFYEVEMLEGSDEGEIRHVLTGPTHE